MRTAWAIYKRELIGTFCSPLAYVVMVAFLVFNGVVFWFFMSMTADNPALTGSRSPLQMFFGSTILSVLTLLVFSPATTMRTFAEERRARTFETLFTAPVTDVEVVAGKFLGAMTFYAALWAPTLLYALVVKRYGPVDWGALAAGYTGMLLIGSAFVALGVLMSAIARSQVVAYMLTFMAIGGVMFALGLGSYVFQEESTRQFFSYVNLWEHMEHFSVGLIDSRALVYYGSVAFCSLALATRTLSVRRDA